MIDTWVRMAVCLQYRTACRGGLCCKARQQPAVWPCREDWRAILRSLQCQLAVAPPKELQQPCALADTVLTGILHMPQV